MGKIICIKSPAKINIGLRVLSKRSDGYHNIETIFYPVKIYDHIKLEIQKLNESKTAIISVWTNSKANINNKNNICFKAADLFLKEFNIEGKYKINIRIRKNIPIGAGLGGGSSNAASVLKILAKYFKIKKNDINEKKLNRCAQDLGSDVPFFLFGKPAYATLRGEKLKSLPKFKINYKILIVSPEVHISTKWAYNQLKIKNYKLRIIRNVKTFKPDNAALTVNDFEKIVFPKYPKIKKIKHKMLELGAVYTLMSGSGSAVYGFFTPQNIKAAKNYFSGLGFKSFIG
ncbi:MAG: 4-(cytidine 5'-diphospho)-2-C-methyl-D-erythritol kinase [Chlorobi bacterium]|nr:4-(cytidine 5'-diphospho)-2-C-methyl-D-erythritol kinase [Chlorobiota bacterium]